MNEFIQGNEIYPLREFIYAYRGTMLGSSEFETFLIKLQKYNRRAKYKFQFIGIDLEYQGEITQKMLRYTKQNKMKVEYEQIIKNQKETVSIQNLEDNVYEIQREKLLIKHFLVHYPKQREVLCFMGAWHVRDHSKDVNFVKVIRKEQLKLLSLEIFYQHSKRTIQEDGRFKIEKVNDKFEENEYKMFHGIGICKTNDKVGRIILRNCHELKMIS